VVNVVSVFTQAPLGVVVDRAGPRRMLVAALLLGGAAFIMLGLTGGYGWLLAASAMAGLANSVYHPADYAILGAEIAEMRVGRAFSIHTFAGFLGGAVAPGFVLGIAAWLGVQAALVAAGLLGPLCLPLAVRRAAEPARNPRRRRARHATRVLSPPVVGDDAVLHRPLPVLRGAAELSVRPGGWQNLAALANVALTTYMFASAIGGWPACGGGRTRITVGRAAVRAARRSAGGWRGAVLALAPVSGWPGSSGMIMPRATCWVRARAPPGQRGRCSASSHRLQPGRHGGAALSAGCWSAASAADLPCRPASADSGDDGAGQNGGAAATARKRLRNSGRSGGMLGLVFHRRHGRERHRDVRLRELG